MSDRTVERNIITSVIIPVYNAGKWLPSCLQSILHQNLGAFGFDALEVSIYDDGSTDDSAIVIQRFEKKFRKIGALFTFSQSKESCMGVGYSRNQAASQSCGKYLCFMDADDEMLPDRIRMQYEACQENNLLLLGSMVVRCPPDSMVRYTNWINSIGTNQLAKQVYTSHGPTIAMPTWFCHRSVYEKVGMFNEGGRGTPEDLMFLYSHLDKGGQVGRLDVPLLLYRYHPQCTTFSVPESAIWKLRYERLVRDYLSTKWMKFTIWNAGRQGRRLYKAMPDNLKDKVASFCDVDSRKIQRGFYEYYESYKNPKPRVPIVHISDSVPPYVICVKLDLTSGVFENILTSLQLTEGEDYVLFG